MKNLEEHDGYQGNIATDKLQEEPSILTNSLDESNDPLVNALADMRRSISSCPEIWREVSNLCPHAIAIVDENLCDAPVELTYIQMEDAVRKAATGFARLGIRKGDKIAVFGENSANWLSIDHGIQMAGGASVVRGADAQIAELRYIFEDSEASNVLVLQGPSLLKKFKTQAEKDGLEGLGLKNDAHGKVSTVVLMHREKHSANEINELSRSLDIDVIVLDELLMKSISSNYSRLPRLSKEDLCTIVYTSGTTGR